MKKRQNIKLAGIITKIENNKIHITLKFPYDDRAYSYEHMQEKILKLNDSLQKELSKIPYDDKIDCIKTYQPFYYEYYTYNVNKSFREMMVKLTPPKKMLYMYRTGSVVEFLVVPKIYHFDDQTNQGQHIRGWSLSIKYMKLFDREKK